LAARTRFFDDQVIAAVANGAGQVVVVGAGYDDRALRFRSPGVRYFELDHPATQADKARRLRSMGVSAAEMVLTPIDFRYDAVGPVLAGCGHDPATRSLFVVEGVLVYLDQGTVLRLLAGLAGRASAHSRLAASLATQRPRGSMVLTGGANARPGTGRNELWRTVLPADAYLGLVERAGWEVGSAVDPAQLDPAVVPGGSLFITAYPARAQPARSRP
jgi:methyltransferase (TIGR00027 family)